MKKLRAWFASSAGKRFFNIFYSLGAAIVVLGAMFKIIHMPYANIIFVTGMIVEVLVFALSAFDTSSYDNTPVTVASGISIDDNIIQGQGVKTSLGGSAVVGGGNALDGTSGRTVVVGGGQTSGSTVGAVTSGSSPVIVVTGGGSGSSAATSGGVSTSVSSGSPVSQQTQQGAASIGANTNVDTSSAQEYAEHMSSAAQNLDDFSKTMQNLNETSQTLLDTYKQIADSQNISETLNTVRYINDSLGRIKNLYDGAIGDSYMFKEEMSKMTRHIEALNNVYARLLQAMTANSNPNNPNQNPPIY